MTFRQASLRIWIAVVFFAVSFTQIITSQALAGALPHKLAVGYKDVKAHMEQLAQTYPKNAQVFNLGLSDIGEMIIGLKITHPNDGGNGVPALVVAAHHGNEYGSTEVARAVAASLAESPLAGQTVYVVPVLNIGGYNTRTRWERAGGRSYDPNRDYPGPCGTEGPFHLKSTKALADFVAEKGIVASATLHTYFPAVVYPWGLSSHDLATPYDDVFKSLCEAATVESQYEIGNSTQVVYAADGTFEDYAFWKHGTWSLLFELGYSHSPDPSAVAELIRVNVPGIRRMLVQAPRQPAANHAFTGKCDTRLRAFDLHNE